MKGKLAGVPVAVVRGLEALVDDDDGPGAAALVRPAGEDWFRHGHVEAVRAALGVPPVVEPVAGKDPAPASACRRRRWPSGCGGRSTSRWPPPTR